MTVTVEAAPAEPGWECAVRVRDAGGSTRHVVSVRPDDLERWGRPGESVEALVERAFAFLLAREPASHILSRFALSDIQRYFPDFDREVRR